MVISGWLYPGEGSALLSGGSRDASEAAGACPAPVRGCATGSRTIGPTVRARFSATGVLIPPDLHLQRPNHPKHECQRQAHWNEKQTEIEVDHEDALRCHIQKARQEAAGRASKRKILLHHRRPPHVRMEQPTCKDFVRGRKEANAPLARHHDATASQSQNIKTVPMMMSSRSSGTQATGHTQHLPTTRPELAIPAGDPIRTAAPPGPFSSDREYPKSPLERFR